MCKTDNRNQDSCTSQNLDRQKVLLRPLLCEPLPVIHCFKLACTV